MLNASAGTRASWYRLCFCMRLPLNEFSVCTPIHAMPSHRHQRSWIDAFTLVEAMVTLAILTVFFLASTATLNLFDTRAAKNRNAEAARALVDDYINYLLADATAAPAATVAGTDLDGDGIADGVLCTAIDSSRAVPATLPLVVMRVPNPSSVPNGAGFPVTGTLYWRVQAVGTAFGLRSNTDLMQVNFMLVYTFRGQNYFYKAATFKAAGN